MSEGPIKRERAAWAPRDVSTPDASRVCKATRESRGYCGRTKTKARVEDWAEVTCADCFAAARADGVRTPSTERLGW